MSLARTLTSETTFTHSTRGLSSISSDQWSLYPEPIHHNHQMARTFLVFVLVSASYLVSSCLYS